MTSIPWCIEAAFCKVVSVLTFTYNKDGSTGTDGGTTTLDETTRDWTFYGNAQLDNAQYVSAGLSLLLDGTSDYIAASDSTDFTFGTQDFTIEMWLNPKAAGVFRVCGQGASAGTTRGLLIYNDGTMHPIARIYDSAGTNYDTGFGAATMSAAGTTWYHFCAERTGATLTSYFNGTVYGTANVSGVSVNDSPYAFAIGGLAGDPTVANFNGWVDDFYVLKGAALHGGTFTPPIGGAPRSTLDLKWTDITQDVLTRNSINMSRGLPGNGPLDRVASSGNMSITLDNSTSNTAGVLGYYSPDSANCRTMWDIGTRIRLCLESGGTTYYRFNGFTTKISPDVGLYRDRGVNVQLADWFEILATYKTKRLNVRLGDTPPVLLAAVNVALSIPTSEINTRGLEDVTLPYSLHSEQDEKTTGLGVFQKAAQSGAGYTYVVGDTTFGESVYWEKRTYRTTAGSVASSGTLSDTMQSMAIQRDSSNIYNTVKAVIYPVTIGTSLVTLSSSPSEFNIPAGGTMVRNFRYRDPVVSSSRVSGLGMVTPVSGTDYKFSFVSGSGGTTANGSVTVTSSLGANSSEISMINNAGSTVYCHQFNTRGTMVSLYDPVEIVKQDETSQITYGERVLSFDMPYQTDAGFAGSISNWFLTRYKTPSTYISGVSFVANANDTLAALGVTADISAKVTITESVSGISSDYFINKVSYQISDGSILNVSWDLDEAPPNI